ncbi:transposon Ty3-I Gag-Pol polyprotein [Vitis vinifera]|uniref:transposon Ty3-I Gag-Pol polyprotein n=1 Tax=Vitis vinifera TaxID=29760 RepID=UPI002882F5A7|nr:transposon Ty3-I Gag-Pol polyprotein [Vitis vinifera]
MEADCCQFVQRCLKCQMHGDLIHMPPSELHALTSPWPFLVRGIDVIGKISPKSSSGHEYILVAIDYFTKWVEAASYARLTVARVAKFIRSYIICRYGVPHELIYDKGVHFRGEVDTLIKGYDIQHHRSNPVANFTINQSKTIIGVFSKSYVRNKGTVRLLFQLVEEGDLDTCEMIKIGALGDAKVKDSQEATVDDPPKLVLKPLPVDLKYAYLEETEKCPVVVSSTLTSDQEDNLLGVLRKCKKAIGWQISDLKGISPLVCTHHIYMEDDAKPVRQPQRRLNPHMQEVKSGITVVQNEKGEEVSTRPTSGWRVCIDYRRLNSVTRKDHFPLPFMDQVLERVSGHPFYCFRDGYSGYFQIEIDLDDQEKTTFTCPFGTFAYRRMPFGLCNAPATFQRCMLSIFSDMVERIMEVFMDDINVYGSSYEECLLHLEAVLQRCIEKDLVLNWEKCHFMVQQGIVLGHIISKKVIEVDKAKVELIVKLPPPTNVKGIRQFLGHAGFYRRFIKDFSKISKPLCELLVKDAKFVWDEKCQKSFEELKQFLTTAPIVRGPNWKLPFEVMCDASDLAMGAVLGQREDGKPYVIYYASKTLNEAQRNYTTTEKELLAVVFALDKFRAYLVGSSIVVFTDHSALKYLLTKQDAKARLIRWILLLQEFNLQIRDKKGVENVVADHLSRLVISHDSHGLPINDDFPEESLMSIEVAPWYSHIANFLVTGEVPSEWSAQDKRHFFAKIHAYYWEEPFLFKYCADQIIRKCVPEQEQSGILSHCHDNACGGHFASQKTAMKVIQSGFWWPSLFKDAHSMCKGCDRCQRLGKLTRRNMMPLNPILIVDVFDVWGIDFMGPFPMSFGHSYILVGVDYVSKWDAPPHLADSASQSRYHTRRASATPVAPTQIPLRGPPTKKTKTSKPGESSRAPQDSQSQPPSTRRPRPSSPIEGNSDCRSKAFHVEAYFEHTMLRQQTDLRESYSLLERYHLGILGARQIAEAFHIPYAPADPTVFRRWAPLSEWDMLSLHQHSPELPEPREVPPAPSTSAPSEPVLEAASSDAPPTVPPTAEPPITILGSEYRALLASFQTLTTTQTAIMERMDHFQIQQEQQTLILREIQQHLSLVPPAPPVAVPSSVPAEDPSYPPEELTP